MKFTSLIIICSLTFSLQAQDTVRISRAEAEVVFLQNNLTLIAEKLHIEQAKAAVLQAKLWPNPTLSIGEVNLWASPRQTGGETVSPPFWGARNFGRNQQFAVEIEQVIRTAGKRKKLIAMEQVGVQQQEQYFQDLLRNLKWEFRTLLTNLQYLQLSTGIFQSQIASIRQLTNAYQHQLNQGNISKGEYIRLKAQELEFTKNISDLQTQINATQKELKLLMGTNPDDYLLLSDADFKRDGARYQQVHLATLFNLAKDSRPDLKIAGLEKSLQEKTYYYERSQRIPDIALNMNYDRNGNTMLDFVGFGVSIDLPFLNRNQGNIRKAKLGVDAAQYKNELAVLQIESEISLAHKNLLAVIQFASLIDTDYESTLEELLIAYTKNFTLRNVSMLEYLDFLGAYLENRKIILDSQKDINDKIEELQYCLGADL